MSDEWDQYAEQPLVADEFEQYAEPAKPVQAPLVQKDQSLLGTAADYVSKTGRQAVSELGALADFVAGTPSLIVQSVAEVGHAVGGYAAKAAGADVSTKEIWERAREYGMDKGEFLANPVQKAIKATEALTGVKLTDQSQVNEMLGSVGGAMEKGAQSLEETTGIPSDAFLAASDVLMAGLGAKGAEVTGKQIGKRMAQSSQDKAVAKIEAAGMDRTLNEIEAPEAVVEAPAPKPAVGPSKAQVDARLNAEQKAYQLLVDGADLKKVEAIRKQNPMVGQVLDEMVARREQVIEAMKYERQGEVIRPLDTVADAPLVGPDSRLAWDSGIRFSGEAKAALEKMGPAPTPRADARYAPGEFKGEPGGRVADPTVRLGIDPDDIAPPGYMYSAKAKGYVNIPVDHPWRRLWPRGSILAGIDPKVINAGPAAIIDDAARRVQVEGDLEISRAYSHVGLDAAVAKLREMHAAAEGQSIARRVAMGLDETAPEAKGMTPKMRQMLLDNPETAAAAFPEIDLKALKAQAGRVDPKLLAAMGAAGIGGTLGAAFASDNKLSGALFGALTGATLPYLRDIAHSLRDNTVPAAEKYAGLMSTRVANINKRLAFRMREHERNIMTGAAKRFNQSHVFLKELAKLKDIPHDQLKLALLNNDPTAIRAAMQRIGNPKLAQGFVSVRRMLDDIGVELKKNNLVDELRDNYFPRVVKDEKGLLNALGTSYKEGLARALTDAQNKSPVPLTQIERSQVINDYLRANKQGGKPSYTKERKIDVVDPALAKFYHNPADSLLVYITSATNSLEKAKFFGGALKRQVGASKIDLKSSIGEMIDQERLAGRLKPEHEAELAVLLDARFKPTAEPLAAVQWFKDVSYAGVLANFASATTQLADVMNVAVTQGIGPTVNAVAKALTKKMDINYDATGLSHKIAEELSSTRKTARFLESTLKYAGFESIDQFGKKVALQAAWNNLTKQAATPKGRQAIVAKYGEALGPEVNDLIQDLQAKKASDLTDSVLFSELSDLQPVSKMEVPQAYLESPNGRVIYMLKTFMLKQFDIARRLGWNEIKKGNYKKGMTNLTKLGVALGIGGASTEMIRQFILGQPLDPKWGDIGMNVLKTFGWSKYTLAQAARGKPLEASISVVLPPTQMYDYILSQDPKAVNYMPVIGNLVYNRMMGGAEEKAAKLEKEKAREENKALRLSDIE